MFGNGIREISANHSEILTILVQSLFGIVLWFFFGNDSGECWIPSGLFLRSWKLLHFVWESRGIYFMCVLLFGKCHVIPLSAFQGFKMSRVRKQKPGSFTKCKDWVLMLSNFALSLIQQSS